MLIVVLWATLVVDWSARRTSRRGFDGTVDWTSASTQVILIKLSCQLFQAGNIRMYKYKRMNLLFLAGIWSTKSLKSTKSGHHCSSFTVKPENWCPFTPILNKCQIWPMISHLEACFLFRTWTSFSASCAFWLRISTCFDFSASFRANKSVS